jgi:peptide/nickel transport system substrate-binding protein
MKKLSMGLALLLIVSMLSGTVISYAEAAYSESPILNALVEAGTLPTVDERLPSEPKLIREVLPEYLDYEIGNYGGTLISGTTAVNWNSDVFVGCNEALLSMSSTNSDEIIGNILKRYEYNEDNTEFTFYLREGLRWSDGEPVSMEDFEFTYNNFIMNSELTPIISANMRAGGKASGTPMTFERLDDWSFKIGFNSSYGGFLVYLSIKGWAGYTDMLKPAHYLKQFHKDYAEENHGSLEAYYEFIRPFADNLGYDDPSAEGVWVYVFNQLDMTNWELTNPTAALTSVTFDGLIEQNFPVLYPWVMQDSSSTIMNWVRNPYYFKVDEAGQQLPYFDYVQSKYVENAEAKLLDAISGNITISEQFFTDYSLLLENAPENDYTVHVRRFHNTVPAIMLNATYGLNTDGSIKDNDAAKAWQDVIIDARFRQALASAIDADEVNDVICLGMASANDLYNCVYDIEGANALLDEMGMIDLDKDGFRETPSGLPFNVQVWNTGAYEDYINAGELYVEYWREIGLNINVYTTEASLFETSTDANEIPMYIFLCHGSELWHYLDWGFGRWDVLWNTWVNAGGLSGDITADSADAYLEPTEEYKNLRLLVQQLMTDDPVTAVNEVLPLIAQQVADEAYVIIPILDQSAILVADSNISNIPEGLQFTCWSSFEFLFDRSFAY